MVRVLEVEAKLPQGFEALEDIDFLTVRCKRCGHEAIYYVGSAQQYRLTHDAMMHRKTCKERSE